MDQGWTDGLPIVPPTEDRVIALLDEAGLAPSQILGTEPVRGRVITAEKVAINGVMAGCRPEYMPILVAAIKAMCEPEFNLHAITISTMGAAVLTIVNGPIASRIGMNSGVSVFGPGNRANATIGRALRLVITNVTGAEPGELDKATLGHPGKYTYCIAEDEESNPWNPLHVDRGFGPSDSTITVFAGMSAISASGFGTSNGDQVVDGLGDIMLAAGPGQSEIVIVMPLEVVEPLQAAGWSRAQVQERLHAASQREASEWMRAGRLSGHDPSDSIGVAESPEGITLVVAGGHAGGFASIIPLWGGGSNSRSVTKKIGGD